MLVEYPVFDTLRETLKKAIRSELFLMTFNGALLAEVDERHAVPTFSREVILSKDGKEKCLETAVSARRWVGGRIVDAKPGLQQTLGSDLSTDNKLPTEYVYMKQKGN